MLNIQKGCLIYPKNGEQNKAFVTDMLKIIILEISLSVEDFYLTCTSERAIETLTICHWLNKNKKREIARSKITRLAIKLKTIELTGTLLSAYLKVQSRTQTWTKSFSTDANSYQKLTNDLLTTTKNPFQFNLCKQNDLNMERTY